LDGLAQRVPGCSSSSRRSSQARGSIPCRPFAGGCPKSGDWSHACRGRSASLPASQEPGTARPGDASQKPRFMDNGIQAIFARLT
jgi:hypothetical protein